jgi:predicted nucleic-acid-binding protein
MIGLDTNFVIRYLVQDDPKQSAQASRLIANAVTNGVMLGISQVTLCEIIWVLEQCYSVNKSDLIIVLKQLLQTQQIRVENDTIAWQALRDFEQHSGVDFSDCLIGRQNEANDCFFTYTFDKHAAKKLPLFKIVDS